MLRVRNHDLASQVLEGILRKLIRNLTIRTELNPLVDCYLKHLRSKWTLNPRIIPADVQIPSISVFWEKSGILLAFMETHVAIIVCC